MKFRYQRWMIKTSLVYLLVGVLMGLFMFLAHRFPAFEWVSTWRAVHVHVILVGSVIQMIMGVALWMFPRKVEPPRWTTEEEGMALYISFNTATIIRSVFEPFWTSAALFYFLALGGMVLQILSIVYFLTLIFQRIRSPGG